MKKKITCISGRVKACVLLLSCLIFLDWRVQAQQTSSVREALSYLSEVAWREPTDALSVMNAERARYQLALAWPEIPSVDKAIYKAYLRLLDYIELALQNGKTMEEAILESYQKVVAEAPADPDLKEMPEGILFTFIPGLVEALTEVPIPQLSGQ